MNFTYIASYKENMAIMRSWLVMITDVNFLAFLCRVFPFIANLTKSADNTSKWPGLTVARTSGTVTRDKEKVGQ